MKPMLAASCDDRTKIRYPVLATPKIDGIRAVVLNQVPTSRSLKPIPNMWVRAKLKQEWMNNLDGELDLRRVSLLTHKSGGGPWPTFQEVSSAMARNDGMPDFIFRVFDIAMPGPYTARIMQMKNAEIRAQNEGLADQFQFLYPLLIENAEQLDRYLAACLEEGHEGVMIRTGDGGYKGLNGGPNRSTFREQWLVKIKPFEDDEAVIIGFEEQMENTNEAIINKLGRSERSGHQAGMVPKGTLGALICTSKKWPGVTFNIGSGLNDAQKQEIWNNQAAWRGRMLKYKFQRIGSLDKPRIPIFLSFPDAELL